MAPLPHNNTAIFYVDYTVINVQHTFELRATGGLSPASLGTFLNTFLGHLSADILSLTVNLVRFAAAGSNVSNPVTTGIEGTVYGSGAGTPDSVPAFLNFIGRSTGGRRVRLAVFGYKTNFSNFRLLNSEDTHVADAVGDLNGLANGALAIDGIKPVWYPYANVGFSAYWIRQVRG